MVPKASLHHLHSFQGTYSYFGREGMMAAKSCLDSDIRSDMLWGGNCSEVPGSRSYASLTPPTPWPTWQLENYHFQSSYSFGLLRRYEVLLGQNAPFPGGKKKKHFRLETVKLRTS